MLFKKKTPRGDNFTNAVMALFVTINPFFDCAKIFEKGRYSYSYIGPGYKLSGNTYLFLVCRTEICYCFHSSQNYFLLTLLLHMTNLAARDLKCRIRGIVHSWPELLDLRDYFEVEVANCAKRGSCHASSCHSETTKNMLVIVDIFPPNLKYCGFWFLIAVSNP